MHTHKKELGKNLRLRLPVMLSLIDIKNSFGDGAKRIITPNESLTPSNKPV